MYQSRVVLVVTFVLIGAALSNGCTCAYQHTQEMFCKSHYAVLASIIDTKELGPHDLYTENTLRVMKVFKHPVKSLVLDVNTTSIKLYTDNPRISTCGLTLEKRKKYIFAGDMSRDNQALHLNLCSMYIPWSDLTAHQKKGFHCRYGKNCQCEIKRVAFQGNPNSSHDECLWNSSPHAYDHCYNKYGTCRLGSDGHCRWMIPKDLRMCKKGPPNRYPPLF